MKEDCDRVYRARPIRLTAQRRVENPLARRILSGHFTDGDTVRVDYADNDFTFREVPAARSPCRRTRKLQARSRSPETIVVGADLRVHPYRLPLQSGTDGSPHPGRFSLRDHS